jgi:Mn-containing catalase
MRAFTLALESMGKPPFSIGKIAPTPKLVDQFFNDSTGEGDHGEVDARGPWNEGEPWEFVESPALQDLNGIETDAPSIHAESSDSTGSEPIQALLVDQLRDILHAEKQLLKALPKMAKAARSVQLQTLFQTHLQETETQVERLNESLQMLGAPARAKPCKGMAGLVEEGDEVMSEAKEKDDAPADLALIGAAQRVEHYEIAAYTTATSECPFIPASLRAQPTGVAAVNPNHDQRSGPISPTGPGVKARVTISLEGLWARADSRPMHRREAAEKNHQRLQS